MTTTAAVRANNEQDLLRLIQFYELNEAGWRERCLDQLTLSSLWVLGGPRSESEIWNHLEQYLGPLAPKKNLATSISRPCKEGKLMNLTKGQVKLSEAANPLTSPVRNCQKRRRDGSSGVSNGN